MLGQEPGRAMGRLWGWGPPRGVWGGFGKVGRAACETTHLHRARPVCARHADTPLKIRLSGAHTQQDIFRFRERAGPDLPKGRCTWEAAFPSVCHLEGSKLPPFLPGTACSVLSPLPPF